MYMYIYRNARARGIVFLFNASRANLIPNGVRMARDIFLSIEYLLISGQRIFPVGMMGKALAHIRHIE